MAYHTARLIFTIIFFILALAGLVSGYWFQAIFWALVALAVGYPFVRNGRIDLYYEDAPTKIVYFMPVPGQVPGAKLGAMFPASVPAAPTTAPLSAPVAPGAPRAIQQLVQGAV